MAYICTEQRYDSKYTYIVSNFTCHVTSTRQGYISEFDATSAVTSFLEEADDDTRGPQELEEKAPVVHTGASLGGFV